MMSGRLFLLLAAFCAASIATIHAVPIKGNVESKRLSQLQHLKQQMDEFKRELDEVLAEGSSPEEEIAETEDKRCDCDGSQVDKRCGCENKKKPKTPPAPAQVKAETEKRCEGCEEEEEESDPQKRCPNGCKSKKKATKTAGPAAAHAAVEDSPIMKRFLSVLPVKDKELIQRSRSKKQFIDQMLRRSHSPNKNEVNADNVASPEMSSVEESSEMTSFKRSLNPAEQQLLKKHSSKSQAIQGFLDREAAEKRTLSATQVKDVINKLGTKSDRDLAQKHLSKIEQLAETEQKPAQTKEEVAKRKLSPAQVKNVINKLKSPSDRAVAEKHLSKVEQLAEAEKRPAGRAEEAAAKRQLSPDQVQQVLNKLGNAKDKALAKEHLSKIEQLAETEQKPVEVEEEAAEVVSRLVQDIQLAKKGGLDLEQLIDALKKRADKRSAGAKH